MSIPFVLDNQQHRLADAVDRQPEDLCVALDRGLQRLVAVVREGLPLAGEEPVDGCLRLDVMLRPSGRDRTRIR